MERYRNFQVFIPGWRSPGLLGQGGCTFYIDADPDHHAWLHQCQHSHRCPANSLLMQGIWSSLLVLSGSFDQLTDMLIFAVCIFYGATSLGVIVLRRRMPDAHRPYKVWGYPFVPIFYILFCIGLFLNTIIAKPRKVGIGLVLILAGILVYLFLRRDCS